MEGWCHVCDEPDLDGDHVCWEANPWAHWRDEDPWDPDESFTYADLDEGRPPAIVTLDTKGLL